MTKSKKKNTFFFIEEESSMSKGQTPKNKILWNEQLQHINTKYGKMIKEFTQKKKSLDKNCC